MPAKPPDPSRASSRELDETARLRGQIAALQARLRSVEELVRIAPAFFGFVSPRGEVLDLNELALRVIGARREDIVGAIFWEAPWWRPIPASAERIRAAIGDATQGRESRFDVRYWAHAPGDPAGTTRWVAVEIGPVLGAAGEVERVAVTGVDVTERREARAALTVERHKLEALFQKSPGAMALWRGDDLVFEMVNPAYEAFFPGRRLLGRPLLEACPELADQPFPALLREVLATGEPYVGREELARIASGAGGTLEDRYYDFTYLRVDDAEGRPLGVYDHAVDVSDRVRARMALEASRAELEAAVRALEEERELRERFVAAVSHDLRTPLSVAKLGAYALARSGGDEEKLASVSARIVRSVDRAERMIRDLLDVSAARAGERITLELVECDLREIAETTIEELASIHGQRFVLESAEHVAGAWDPLALRRILENLASNAVKYGAADAPITIALRAEGARVAMAVHNQGAPIPPDDQARIFEPFHRSGSAAQRTKVGWGLGLMLVRALAEAHGGSVEVTSTEGAGTTFSVWLPADARATAAP